MTALGDHVVVLTGASSGIGRATALLCARRGASLVLGARRELALEDLARECRAAGGQAVVVAGDVADPETSRALAAAAVERFGRIDAWINDAGVYGVGRFEATPPEVFDRMLDVNLRGTVYGSREALNQFRAQGDRGVLINISSMVGGLAGALASAYATSKWGVRGLTLALHEELRDEPRMHACVVRPAAIDTPIFRHGANYSGHEMRALTPTYPPEQAAATVVALITEPRREVIIGRSGRLLSALHAVAPATIDRIFAERSERDHFLDRAAAPTSGNVLEPDPRWTTASGAWKTTDRRRAALLLPIAALGVAVAVLRR